MIIPLSRPTYYLAVHSTENGELRTARYDDRVFYTIEAIAKAKDELPAYARGAVHIAIGARLEESLKIFYGDGSEPA